MKPKLIAFDVETTNLFWYSGSLYSLAIAWHEGTEIKSASWKFSDVPSEVFKLLADEEVEKVGHRVRFDLKWLLSRGVKVAGRTHCTKIMQHLINENEPNGLKDLTRKHFGADALKDESEMKALLAELKLSHVGQLCAVDLAQPDPAISRVILRYNREDAVNTARLYPVLRERLLEVDRRVRASMKVKRGPAHYYLNESLPSERALLQLELGGIGVDRARLEAYGEELRRKQEEILTKLNDEAGHEVNGVIEKLWEKERAKKKTAKGKLNTPKPEFNWTSAQHLGMLVYERFGVPARYTAKKKYAASEEVLGQIAASTKIPRLANILNSYAELKKLQKEETTYAGDESVGIISRITDGRIYAEYHPFTDTGRLGSANPNMQNLPRQSPVKRAFVPSPGNVFIYCDYSQVELRIAAHLSQDKTMVNAFRGGLDLHKLTAAALFGVSEDEVTDEQRQRGKCVDPQTLITLNGKLTRIGDLSKNAQPGEFVQQQGDVWCNGETVPLKAGYADGEKDAFLVISRKGILVCSDTHRLLCADGTLKTPKELVEGKTELVVSSLKAGEGIQESIPFFAEDTKGPLAHVPVTPSLAYFAGLVIGDGTVNKNAASIACGWKNAAYKDWAEEIKLACSLVGVDATINRPQTNNTGSTTVSIYLGSRKMVNFLQQLEIATYEDVSKRLNVPSWVLNGTSETKAAFIAGLMDTDGYVQNKGGGAITSKSWELIQDLSVVCASLGWKYSLKADLNKEYCRHYYTISISRFYLHNLLPYMRCSWKIAALTSAKPRTEKQYETVWAANVVKQVLPLGKRKLVDIEVDSSQHLYTANTFVTHNTCNFLLIFDGGPRRLNEEMPEFSLETCKGFKLSYFERYPDYHNFLKKTLALGKKKLAAVSENGRVRRLPDLALGEFINWERRRFMGPPEMIARLSESLANKKKPVTQETLWDEAGLKFSHAKKQLYNFPMQTTGASITKAALSRLFLEGLRVVTTVHDSIVVEVPEESADELAQKIRHIMETAYPLSVPLKVDLKILTSLSEKDVWIPAIKTVKKIA